MPFPLKMKRQWKANIAATNDERLSRHADFLDGLSGLLICC